MDLTRYLSLYRAETQEHLRALNRGLLELERSGDRGLEEAFRSVHTIKGMAATMGHTGVSDLAHRLEDQLAGLRAAPGPVAHNTVDDLLRAADALEHEVERATTAPDGGPQPGAGPDSRTQPATDHAPEIAIPAGAALVRVVLRDDAPLKSVRATMIRRNAEHAVEVLSSSPDHVDDNFGGVLHLVVPASVDHAELERAIRAAGDVERVEFAVPGAPGAPVQEEALQHKFVRIDQSRLDDMADDVGELATMCVRLEDLVRATPAAETAELADRMRKVVAALQETVLEARMVPVGEVFERFPRVVRDAARSIGKDIDFTIEGADIQLDRAILEQLAEPLVHLLRNAVAHGVETPVERVAAGKPARGKLVLRAARVRASVLIQVEDDGAGIDAVRVFRRAEELGMPVAPDSGDALLQVLSHPGFSTAGEVSSVSGRGVGLDAVVTSIRALGGVVGVRSQLGTGTEFSLRLPTTLAVAQVLRVKVGAEDYALPLTHVSEVLELSRPMVTHLRGAEVVRVRGDLLPLVRMRALLEAESAGAEGAAVVMEIGERRVALAVDRLVAREQIVVKSFDSAVGALPYFSGVTLLADGRPALVLDPASVS